MNIIGTMRALDETRGAVRVEDVYDTDIDDLWEACTTPERLARWIAEVSGDLRVGGTIHAVFTSTWTGPGRVEVCDAPHHLLLTMEPGTDDESQMEAWLIEEGSQTRLVVEERGLPVDKLYLHGAGWQAHLEDLGRSLAEATGAHPERWTEQTPAPAWRLRWDECPLPTQRWRSSDVRRDQTQRDHRERARRARPGDFLRRAHRRRHEGERALGDRLRAERLHRIPAGRRFPPPVWPGADVPMQMHLDFFVDDLEATGARAVAAGATRHDFQPNSDHCFVYADPAGHPFCLSTWDGPHLDDKPDE